MENGKTYRFISRAKNPIGYSDFSAYGYIAFGDVPSPMARPLITASSETSLSVVWSAPAVSSLPIKGYILNIDNGDDTDPVPVYIGTNRPDILSFVVGGLTTGLPYQLTVQASNVNGLSQPSPISSFYACSPPSRLQTPYYISSSQNTIEIGWQPPLNLGGCPVLGYQIFINNGLDDNVDIEVQSFDSQNPNINQYLIDMSATGVVGRIYKIKIRSSNYEGTTDSNSLSVALASLPSKPTNIPVSDPEITN
jgi:hypothetical protein